MKAIMPIAWMLVVLWLTGTLWADHKSRERTACYQHAQTVAECPQPGAIESAIRWLYSSQRREGDRG